MADLAAYDTALEQMETMEAMAAVSDSITVAQDLMIVQLNYRLKVAADHISDVEQVVTDQLATMNAMERKHKKEKRRGYLLIGGLLGALILTNL